MKKGLYICIIAVAAMAACHKNKGPANAKSVQQNNSLDTNVFMNATINGGSWHTDSAWGNYVKYSGNDSTRKGLYVIANNTAGTGSSIHLNIANYVGPDTYLIDPPLNSATYYTGSTQYSATSGAIIITSDTGYALLGIFNFFKSGANIAVSNGSFNVAKP